MRTFARTPFSLLMSMLLLLSTAMFQVPSVVAAPPVLPLPGEDYLTPAERQAALHGMPASERAAIGHLFRDDAAELVVAYVRQEYRVVHHADGSSTVTPSGAPAVSPTGRVTIPSHATAGCCDYASKSGTQLSVSFTVTRTRTTAPHEWRLYGNAQWGVGGSWSPRGMDCCNNDDDAIAMAWGNNAAFHSDASNGRYQSQCIGEPSRLPVQRADIHNNRGISHAFREWWDPDNCPMYWVSITNHIRRSTFTNTLTNATLKYVHTWSNHDWRIGFGAGGASISISPTSGQWSLPLVVSFDS
jgi:hypothetical protein